MKDEKHLTHETDVFWSSRQIIIINASGLNIFFSLDEWTVRYKYTTIVSFDVFLCGSFPTWIYFVNFSG